MRRGLLVRSAGANVVDYGGCPGKGGGEMNVKRLVIAERIGVGIALAAILVQAPRLVLAVLAADRLPVAVDTERALLVVAGLGTALVLTGGNLYLAHTIARVRRGRRAPGTGWLGVLGG